MRASWRARSGGDGPLRNCEPSSSTGDDGLGARECQESNGRLETAGAVSWIPRLVRRALGRA